MVKNFASGHSDMLCGDRVSSLSVRFFAQVEVK